MLRDEDEYERWLDAGRSSLRMVDLAIGAGEHAAACFHAEQASQLVLKAVLHGLGAGDRAFGHSLVMLGRATEQALGVLLPESLQDALVRLARHYIPTRYPDALPQGLIREHYRRSDADVARDDALVVMAYAADLWAQAGEAAHEQADQVGDEH